MEKLSDMELLAKAVDEFQNEGDDEWGLDIESISDFIYWLKHQERYQEVYKYFLI